MNVRPADTEPLRIDLVLQLWTRIARTIDALRSLYTFDAEDESTDSVRERLESVAASERETTVEPTVLEAVRILAWQDNMHAADWLRMRGVEALLPRRKQALVTDLQIRLKGVQAKRIVMSAVTEEGAYRVTVHTFQGDVVSALSDNFVNALNGAIAMAGARKDDTK